MAPRDPPRCVTSDALSDHLPAALISVCRCGLAHQREERSVRKRMALSAIVEGMEKPAEVPSKESLMKDWRIRK